MNKLRTTIQSELGNFDDTVLAAISANMMKGEAISPDFVAMNSVITAAGKEDGMAFNEGQLAAAQMAAAASVNFEEVMQLTGENFGKSDAVKAFAPYQTSTFDFVGESFSSASPSEIAALHYEANLKISKQNEFAELLFPMYVLPAGTTSFKFEVQIEESMNTFLRDGSKVKKAFKPLGYDLTSLEGIFSAGGNRIFPVVGIKDDYDDYLDLPAKSNVIDPVSGDTIETAPILVGTKVPLIDISQSAAELANGVPDADTTLSPGARVTSLHLEIGAERIKMNTTSLRDARFFGTPNGDSVMDLQLYNDSDLYVDIAGLLKEDGTANAELADGAGAIFLYNLRLSGSASTTEKEAVVDINAIELKGIFLNGVEIKAGDAGYTDLKAAADKVTKAAVKSVTIEAYITNEDMRREGVRITVNEKSEEYALIPLTPFTIIVPAKGFAGRLTDGKIVSGLTTYIVPLVNFNAVRTLVNAADEIRELTVDGTIVPDQKKGVGSYFCRPTYIKETVDLTNAVNNWQSSQKDDDISASIVTVAKNVITNLMVKSGLGEVREQILNEKHDMAMAVGSDLATFLPSEFKFDNITVKIVSTRLTELKSTAYIVPGNFNSNRNTALSPVQFGAYLYTPVLIGETPANKKMEYKAQPIGLHAVFNHVLAKIDFTGLNIDGVIGN